MKKLAFLIVALFLFISTLSAARVLVITQNKNDVMGMGQLLKDNKVEFWFIAEKGPVTGEKVFEYVDKNAFIIRVLGKGENFTDDESMILEDYISSRGSLAYFGYSNTGEFFDFPLLKDYFLVAPGKILENKKLVSLYPDAKDVFGEESIFVKGNILSLGIVPEAPDWIRWGYSTKDGNHYSAVIKSCTFKVLYFPFFWNQLATQDSKKRILQGAISYFTRSSEVERLPSTGTVMKDFELVDLAGNKQSLSKYYGKKAVVLAYFATWCSHCQKEVPLLQEYNDPTAPYQILAASFKEEKKVVEEFVAKYKITFPVMPDEKGSLRRLYRIPTVPVLFFISKDGVLKYLYRGEISRELLEQKLTELSQDRPTYKNKELLLNHIINGGNNQLRKYIK